MKPFLCRRRTSYLSCCWTGTHSWRFPSTPSSFLIRPVNLHQFSHQTVRTSSHRTQMLLLVPNQPLILSRYRKQLRFMLSFIYDVWSCKLNINVYRKSSRCFHNSSTQPMDTLSCPGNRYSFECVHTWSQYPNLLVEWMIDLERTSTFPRALAISCLVMASLSTWTLQHCPPTTLNPWSGPHRDHSTLCRWDSRRQFVLCSFPMLKFCRISRNKLTKSKK